MQQKNIAFLMTMNKQIIKELREIKNGAQLSHSSIRPLEPMKNEDDYRDFITQVPDSEYRSFVVSII